MKTFQLEGKSREVAATSADQKRALKAMRKNNEIPAVLYGGEKVSHFTITKDSVRNLVYSPEIFVVELTIDGKKTMAIVKDIQFQPVTDAILHMDFLEVSENKPVVLFINVDHLGLGKTMQVGALHFEGLELMNAKNAVVCAVQLTRAARGAQAKA